MIKFENRNNGRFYYLVVEKDILNDTVLMVIHGGKSSRFIRKIVVNDNQMIEAEIARLTKKRLSRGYVLV